eukprot:7896422-Alexandrium_andersonii.AAC.1
MGRAKGNSSAGRPVGRSTGSAQGCLKAKRAREIRPASRLEASHVVDSAHLQLSSMRNEPSSPKGR